MRSLVMIPAFNEEKSIEKVVMDIRENAPSFDYIIINDCSNDKTLELCKKKKYPILNLPINLGIGGAVQTGYLYAKKHGYDIAVQFDGDGQHDAKYLESMMGMLIEHKLDMLIGSRFIEKEGFQSSKMRRLGIKYFTFLIYVLTKKRITDPTSGMRMANRTVIEIFAKDYPKDYPEPESVVSILKMNKIIEEYPVIMRERVEGISSISAIKSIYYMIKVTIAMLVEKMRRD
ncbi:MAG TPA: glycosyltransferase family 2 protein [Lachnospiraceae bacterium]|nr:glycosyltransferase family 2 protein [Lachnospiraceae bacterium]